MCRHEEISGGKATNPPVAMEKAKIDAEEKEKEGVSAANFQTVKASFFVDLIIQY